MRSSAVAEARQTSAGSLGLGTTCDQVLRLLSRRLEIAFEETGFEPNTLLEIGRFSGCLRAAVGRRRFEAVPAGSRVTFSGEGASGRFFTLLEPRVAAAAKRQARTGLASLKDVLESQQQHGEHL